MRKKGHQFHQQKNLILTEVKMETIKIKIKEVEVVEIDKWSEFKLLFPTHY